MREWVEPPENDEPLESPPERDSDVLWERWQERPHGQ